LKPITEPLLNAASDRHDNSSPAVSLVLLMIRGYKLLISPYFRGSCCFLPSCADYAAAAVTERGVILGGWLALRRLARCHPLGKAGYDPVPTAGRSRHPQHPQHLLQGEARH